MLIKNEDHCLGCFAPKNGLPVCPVCGWYEGLAIVADDGPVPGTVLYDRYAIGRILEMDDHSTSYLAMDVNTGIKVVLTRHATGAQGEARYEAAPYAERSARQEPPPLHTAQEGAPSPARAKSPERPARSARPSDSVRMPSLADPAWLSRFLRAAMRVPAWVYKRGRLVALVCAAVLVLAGSAALASLLLGSPADDVESPTAEPVLHAAQTAVPDTAPPETPASLTATPTPAPTPVPTPVPTPPPASQAAETPVPEWSDWQEAHAQYVDDPAYVTESRTEYRFARVLYEESGWSEWSASPPPASSTEKEVSYRTSTFMVIYDDSPAVSGYTFTGVITARPGEWSEWGTEEIVNSEYVEVETRKESGTAIVATYRYSRYLYATQDESFDAAESDPGNGVYQISDWLDVPLTPMGSGAYGTLMMNGVGTWFNEEVERKEVVTDELVTQYRSRELREMYEHAGWGDWSEWQSGTPPESKASMRVEARYRFKTRTEKIDAWSKWQEEAVEAKKDLKVEKRILYRYIPQP